MNDLSGLIHVSDDQPGFSREKSEDGFIYFDEEGKKIENNLTIKRINDLVIPPNWQNVWICSKKEGHLQSTGFDVEMRKQYIYHPKWIEFNQENKFNKLEIFGKCLPRIRSKINEDLTKKEWTKRKVLALIVYILDKYYLRIGNDYYAKKNNTYGLTTLRRKHLDDLKDGVQLSYKAKSNKERELIIHNEQLASLIKEISDLPGYEIFRYKEGYRNWTSISSEDVNLYIKELVEQDFTAKYFRTWGGTKLAVELLAEAKQKVKENNRRSLEPTLVKLVAKHLGNTPSVCKDYYIHPDVLHSLMTEDDLQLKQEKDIDYNLLDPSEEYILNVIQNENK